MPRKTALDLVEPPPWPQEVEWGGERFFVIGRFHFLVESASEPGEFHCLDLEGVEDYEGACTCRSSETRHWCRHERVVRAWVDQLDKVGRKRHTSSRRRKLS